MSLSWNIYEVNAIYSFVIVVIEFKAFALKYIPSSFSYILRQGFIKLLNCLGWAESCDSPASQSVGL